MARKYVCLYTFAIWRRPSEDLRKVLVHYRERAWIECCFVNGQIEPGQAIEGVLPNGLILGHAYSITAVKQVETNLRQLINWPNSISSHSLYWNLSSVAWEVRGCEQWRSKEAGGPCSDICVWPLPPTLKRGSGGVTPGKFLKFYFAVGEF